jgi:hypothetical protein
MLTFALDVLTGFGVGFGTLVAIGRCVRQRQRARPTSAEARQAVQERLEATSVSRERTFPRHRECR